MFLGAYSSDEALLQSLGLRTTDFGGGWTNLGTVVVEEAEPDGEFGPRPASTVRVEVQALPAQFWRFTVIRPRDACETLPDGSVRGTYEPLEVRVVTTGSGTFTEYWAVAAMVAHHLLDIENGH